MKFIIGMCWIYDKRDLAMLFTENGRGDLSATWQPTGRDNETGLRVVRVEVGP